MRHCVFPLYILQIACSLKQESHWRSIGEIEHFFAKKIGYCFAKKLSPTVRWLTTFGAIARCSWRLISANLVTNKCTESANNRRILRSFDDEKMCFFSSFGKHFVALDMKECICHFTTFLTFCEDGEFTHSTSWISKFPPCRPNIIFDILASKPTWNSINNSINQWNCYSAPQRTELRGALILSVIMCHNRDQIGFVNREPGCRGVVSALRIGTSRAFHRLHPFSQKAR